MNRRFRRLTKIGNSQGVLLPAGLLEGLNVKTGQFFKVARVGRYLVLYRGNGHTLNERELKEVLP